MSFFELLEGGIVAGPVNDVQRVLAENSAI